MTDMYVKHRLLNLYRRAGFDGIAYGDGGDAERRIGEIISGATDRSVFSVELARAITDWPSEYHLSRQRHCLLRPLDIAPGARVLEIGCGCGALTRYLGEIGARVTALEGAPARARIAATRCVDLSNVAVIAEDLLRFVAEETFDWILLVGVLEYAPLFSPEPDAVQHYLRRAAALLAPQGRLVVAIENKLGVKYFNGCGEDHLNVPFSGVQGLYDAGTPRTFGHRELQSQLNMAGLGNIAFHYPFPDYKLPQVILSDAALADPQFKPADMLAMIRARDYAGSPHRLFDEALVLREAARNQLLGEFSNSFLVVASRQAPDSRSPPAVVLATSYGVQRVPEFRTQTLFVRDGDTVRVRKERLHPRLPRYRPLTGESRLENITGDADYIVGESAIWKLLEARARRGDLQQILAALEPWFTHLLHMAATMSANAPGSNGEALLSDLMLPGHALDLTPFNLIGTGEGLVPIDQEWRIDHDIALGFVATRGVLMSLTAVPGFEASPIAIADVVRALAQRCGLGMSESDIAIWLGLESALQTCVSGERVIETLPNRRSAQALPLHLRVLELETNTRWLSGELGRKDEMAARLSDELGRKDGIVARLSDELGRRDSAIARLDEQLAASQSTVEWQRREIAAFKNSRSWRLTAPLRALQRRLPFRIVNLIKQSDALLSRYRDLHRTRHGYREQRQIEGAQPFASSDGSLENLSGVLALIGSDAPAAVSEPLPAITIVVPVYNGLEHLKRLLPSLAWNTDPRHPVVIIDDASSDEAILPYLELWGRSRPHVRLIRSAENRGFVRSVNAGAAMATGHFVIVNTDTEMPPDWLERIVQPILADRTVASVTPFSNSATIFSFPNPASDNTRIGGLATDDIDAGFRAIRVPPAIPLEAPTGVGFCMAINADVWRAIGGFDEIAFPKGYGEENDWCQRAVAAGFRNVLAPDLFVYHAHGGSFAPSDKAVHARRGLAVVERRWPDYLSDVATFMAKDPWRRIRLAALLNICCAMRPVVIVDHAIGGGANAYRHQFERQAVRNGRPVAVITFDRIAGHYLLDLSLGMSAERFFFRDVSELSKLPPFRQGADIIYNNLVSWPDPMMMISLLQGWAQHPDARLTILFHDYFPLCPSYNLLDRSGRYCGVPDDLAVCESCLPANRHASTNARIRSWRERWRALLEAADDIVFFSQASAEIAARAFPFSDRAVHIRPHRPLVQYDGRRGRKIAERNPVIGVVGSLNFAKGAEIVRELCMLIARTDPDMRVVVIGNVDPNEDLSAPNLAIHGAYDRAELPALLASYDISVCVLPSIWPETFSYVTQELMSLEMPLICFDLGAPAQRVRDYEYGKIAGTISAGELLAGVKELLSKSAFAG